MVASSMSAPTPSTPTTSSRSRSKSTTRSGTGGIPPPAQNFEIVIARKIQTIKMPLLQTFMRVDEDGDNKISKGDLKNALRGIFEMDLSDEQIGHIFKRSAYFAPPKEEIAAGVVAVEEESREDSDDHDNRDDNDDEHNDDASDSSLDSLNCDEMGYRQFSNYVEQTANAIASSSSVNFGSTNITASPQRYASKSKTAVDDRKSISQKTKELKSIVYKHIQQRVPSCETESGINFSFLQMDTERNNEITGTEFQDWLNITNGLNFSEDDMMLIRGDDWSKDDGLSYQEFDSFVNDLMADSRLFRRPSSSSSRSIKTADTDTNSITDGNSKTDVELIWAFMNYFRDHRKPLVEAFDILDVTNSKGLSAQDIQRGLKIAGVSIGLDRAKRLTCHYVDLGGRMKKPGFVRMMTSTPRVIEDF